MTFAEARREQAAADRRALRCCGRAPEAGHELECPENEAAGECEACGERAELERVHGAGLYCPSCHADHPLTIERARADANEDD